MDFNPFLSDDLPEINYAQLLTLPHVMKILSVSERTVWRMIASRRIPAPMHVGSGVRWRPEVIKAWIDDGCPPQDDQPA